MITRDQLSAEVGRACGLSPASCQWQDDTPVGPAFVVTAPWARVVVGRTTTQVEQFIEAFCDGGSRNWLSHALVARFPRTVVEWQPLAHVGAFCREESLRDFVAWAGRSRSSWPVAAGLRVVGAWRRWEEAVLIVRDDGAACVRARRRPDWNHPFRRTRGGSQQKQSHPSP